MTITTTTTPTATATYRTPYILPLPNTGGARSNFIRQARKAVENYRAGYSATEGMERIDAALATLMQRTRGRD